MKLLDTLLRCPWKRDSGIFIVALLAWGPFSASVYAEGLTPPRNEVRVLVTSRNWAVMSSEITAPISGMLKHPGESFKKGDVLVSFDCATYAAQRAGGAADVRQAVAQLESKQRLLQLQSIGALEVEIERTNLDRARANLQLLDVYLKRCKIAAPYAGTVVRWLAQPFQTAGAGDDVIEIVGSSALELEMIVPSSWLAWLKTGQALTAHIDETGTVVPGTISHLGARIDPVSQTIKVYATLTESSEGLLPGMSGRATIPSL